MMDLSPEERTELLRHAPGLRERWGDPTYLPMRAGVEAAMRAQLESAGVSPRREHPHYALLGRSARVEAAATEGRIACALPLDDLPLDCVTWTWGDSMRLDPLFRQARGTHPASGRARSLEELPEALARWGPTVDRAAWMEIELQLWYDPTDYALRGA